jgi:hypothetical protein
MGNQRENYFFLDFQGKRLPPNDREVRDSDLSSRPFMLIPDNNICIHMSENDLPNQDKIKKARVSSFLNYCHTSNITILPDYGLVERASQPGTLALNKEKLIHFADIFWKKLGRYESNDRILSVVSKMEYQTIYIFYAYLLKIKLILVKREASRMNAKFNLQDLYEFTEKIGINIALPWQFSIAIIGGKNELSKFIRQKKGDVFRGLWGAAWDLFYIQLAHEYNGTRERDKGCFPRFILVTDDGACSTIGDFAKVTAAFDFEHALYHEVQVNSDFPHLRTHSSFLDEIISKMKHDSAQRVIARESMSELELQNDNEKIINRTHSLILELSEQIQFHGKKGFG